LHENPFIQYLNDEIRNNSFTKFILKQGINEQTNKHLLQRCQKSEKDPEPYIRNFSNHCYTLSFRKLSIKFIDLLQINGTWMALDHVVLE
jgi:hypothetical protein